MLSFTPRGQAIPIFPTKGITDTCPSFPRFAFDHSRPFLELTARKGSPKWISENGDKLLEDYGDMWEQIKNVPMPQDPVTGGEGHLTRAWKGGSGNDAVV